jgi:hypothetical protein
MRQKSESQKPSSERIVKDIRRATRKQYSAEEKIGIVLDGLRGEHSVAESAISSRTARTSTTPIAKAYSAATILWPARTLSRSNKLPKEIPIRAWSTREIVDANMHVLSLNALQLIARIR